MTPNGEKCRMIWEHQRTHERNHWNKCPSNDKITTRDHWLTVTWWKRKGCFPMRGNWGQSCVRIHCLSLCLVHRGLGNKIQDVLLPCPSVSGSVWGSQGNLAATSTICKPHAVNFHLSIKLFYGHITRAQSRCMSQASVQHGDIKRLWIFQIRCYLKLGLNGFPESEFVVKLGLEIWCLDA